MIKNKIYLPLFIGLAIAIGVLIGSNLNFNRKSVLFSTNTNEAKIKRLINYIQYDYVDEVDTDSLLDNVITDMLVKLDPHSVYIPKEEMQRVTENMQGSFVGIGVAFLMHKDSITITNVIDKGPSEKAGIKAGDRIILADNDSLVGKNLLKKAGVLKNEEGAIAGNQKISEAILKALKGEPETKVNVTVYRRSTNEVLKFPIARGEVAIKSVSAYYMITPTLGYIRVDRFARTTYDEFKKGLDELISEGMTSVILDLRGNPGGFMDIANSIVDEFLEDVILMEIKQHRNLHKYLTLDLKGRIFKTEDTYLNTKRNHLEFIDSLGLTYLEY